MNRKNFAKTPWSLCRLISGRISGAGDGCEVDEQGNPVDNSYNTNIQTMNSEGVQQMPEERFAIALANRSEIRPLKSRGPTLVRRRVLREVGGATSGPTTTWRGGFSGGIFSPELGVTLGGGFIKRPCSTISRICDPSSVSNSSKRFGDHIEFIAISDQARLAV